MIGPIIAIVYNMSAICLPTFLSFLQLTEQISLPKTMCLPLKLPVSKLRTKEITLVVLLMPMERLLLVQLIWMFTHVRISGGTSARNPGHSPEIRGFC